MEKKQRKNLIVELTGRIEFEKLSGTREKEIVVGGSFQRLRRTMSHPLTLPKKEFDQLVALSKFLRIHTEITQEDLNELLETKFSAFVFLRKVNNMLPDFLDELKDHGPQSVACYYVSRMQVNEQLEKKLP